MRIGKLFFLIIVLVWAPAALAGSFSISTEAQTIAPNTASDAITVTAGTPVPSTTCLLVSSNSSSGQFSSSATNWNPVAVVTMSKNTSNRSFFYKDTAQGSFELTVKVAPKPDTVTASCSSWSDVASAVAETLTQTITVGSGQSTAPPPPTGDSSSTPQTPSLPAQTMTVGSSGSETLAVVIKTQPVVVVGAGSFFSGSASDSGGPKTGIVRYIWNFGDGATAEGQTTFHTYTYPGTYVASLTSAAGNEAGIARLTVQATPAQIGVLAQPDGSVVLANQLSQELNIGLWSITSGTTTFSIPQDTILLGNQRIQFAPNIMHMSAGADAALQYPNGTLVAVAVPRTEAPPAVVVPQKKMASVQNVQKPTQPVTTPPSTVFVAAAGETKVPVPTYWAYGLVLIGIVCVGLGAASYFKKGKETNTPEDEFEIE